MSIEIRRPLQRNSSKRNRMAAMDKPSILWRLTQKLKGSAIPMGLLGVGILLGVYGFPWLQQRMNLPIEKIIVDGDLQYLERRELVEMVPVYLGDRWLDASLSEIQRTLEQQPWVYSAQVSREWPSALRISIQEQKPIARWNDDQVLNQYGQVFDRDNKVLQNLPELLGDAGSEKNVMERFLEFSQMVSPLYMRLVRLELDERLSWSVTLDNDIVIKVGNTDALERMQRFVRLYRENLASDISRVAQIDLRYNSGAAVQWLPVKKTSG